MKIPSEYINKWGGLDHKGDGNHGSGDSLRYTAEWWFLDSLPYPISIVAFIGKVQDRINGQYFRNPDKLMGRLRKIPLLLCLANLLTTQNLFITTPKETGVFTLPSMIEIRA